MGTVYRREYSHIIREMYGKELQEKYALFRRFQKKPEKVFMRGMEVLAGLWNTRVVFDKLEAYDIDKLFEVQKCGMIHLFECIFNNRDMVYAQGKNPTRYPERLDAIAEKNQRLKGSWEKIISEVPKLINEMDKFLITCPPEEIVIVQTYAFVESKNPKNCYRLEMSRLGIDDRIRVLKYSASMDFLVLSVNALRQKSAASSWNRHSMSSES